MWLNAKQHVSQKGYEQLQEVSLKGRSIHIFHLSSFLLARMQMWWLVLQQLSWIRKWKFHAEFDGAVRQKEPWVPDIMKSHSSPRISSCWFFLEERKKKNPFMFKPLTFSWPLLLSLMGIPNSDRSTYLQVFICTSSVPLKMPLQFIFLPPSPTHTHQIVSFLSSFKIQLQIQMPTWKWLVLLTLFNPITVFEHKHTHLHIPYVYVYTCIVMDKWNF